MSERQQVQVSLHGPPGQAANFSDFANLCSGLQLCLKQVARCIAMRDVEFDVAQLSIGSALVTLTAADPAAAAVAGVFNRTVQSLEAGDEVDVRLDSSALYTFYKLAAPLQKPGVSVEISGIPITENFKTSLSRELHVDLTSQGSTQGRLEGVSIHSRAVFTLYPPIAGEKIECAFDPQDLDRVKQAIGRNVTVYGKLHFGRKQVFPTRVEVSEFEVESDDALLPDLLDSKGLMSGEESSVDTIRGLRNEW